MLDQTTKRKLDSARQILVGKVPDPKAQVEQITTALVYKFMDDMDKESEELGGEAKFFANGFSQYAWTKLLDNKLSGQERLDLYVQAITNMSKNPHIPQLFRDILKGAFLPYNDPRTLSLFLKEINEFNYEHSENLGNAFEYLLSILGSQGDAGQFRTPRHIIDFIVKVVDPKKNETILDPACGTAGFLISAYKHILKQNKEKTLTPDEKLKLMNNLAGYDISPDMVKLALVNMYLHGFPEPKIHEYDSLTSEKRWDETFDVILANPPFMSPSGGIVPHKKFSIQANRAEVLFVDYIVEHLNINGRAGIIIPEGVIFKNDASYKQLRKNLVEYGLYAVVSLPPGVFNPYSGIKTNILFFDNNLSKKTDEILFIKVLNDGFDLGAQRRSRPDLPNDLFDKGGAIDVLKAQKKAIVSRNKNKLVQKNSRFAWSIKKEIIAESGDYRLSGDFYHEDRNKHHHKWETVELGDVLGYEQPTKYIV
ncbi:MAG: N-6 DNA methylase, partial [Candidatus Moranbacteria bacterium]|nr:N-6 DNA methylase [Candidatus Moranbacteria bacterium]